MAQRMYMQYAYSIYLLDYWMSFCCMLYAYNIREELCRLNNPSP